jgi:hypothetical protein
MKPVKNESCLRLGQVGCPPTFVNGKSTVKPTFPTSRLSWRRGYSTLQLVSQQKSASSLSRDEAPNSVVWLQRALAGDAGDVVNLRSFRTGSSAQSFRIGGVDRLLVTAIALTLNAAGGHLDHLTAAFE